MSIILLRILWVVLAILWASGMWARRRRRRGLTDRDFREAEQWRMGSRAVPHHEDPLMVSIDIGLWDGFDDEEVLARSAEGASATDAEGLKSPRTDR